MHLLYTLKRINGLLIKNRSTFSSLRQTKCTCIIMYTIIVTVWQKIITHTSTLLGTERVPVISKASNFNQFHSQKLDFYCSGYCYNKWITCMDTWKVHTCTFIFKTSTRHKQTAKRMVSIYQETKSSNRRLIWCLT